MKRYILLSLLSLIATVAAEEPKQKFIISLGDIPTTTIFRKNISSMERVPLDGVILTATYADPAHGRVPTYTHIWQPFAIPYASLAEAEQDLRATQVTSLTENFIRIDILPGDVDWFSNGMDAVQSNFRMMARLAKRGGLRGIFLDTEPYQKAVFRYAACDQGHSFKEYQVQVRRWGTNIMRAMAEEFPDIVVLLTFGYYVDIDDTAKSPEERQFGLYSAFLDGMFDATRDFPRVRIVNGNEQSYACKVPYCFEYGVRHSEGKKYQGTSSQFPKTHENAFALWIDRVPPPFDLKNLISNFFTPAEFERSLNLALQYTDRYVWIYSPEFQWFNAPTARLLPAPYVDALRAVRR